MKKLIVIATLAALMLAGVANAAQNSATASSVPVTADIVSAIHIEKEQGLNFGQIVAGATLGVVTLTPLNARSSTGGATLANSTGVQPATFEVSGEGSSTFAITLPSTPVTITSGANTMSVDTFATPSSSLSLVSGEKSFAVGASLHVGANQPSGHYAGTFNVSVAYN